MYGSNWGHANFNQVSAGLQVSENKRAGKKGCAAAYRCMPYAWAGDGTSLVGCRPVWAWPAWPNVNLSGPHPGTCYGPVKIAILGLKFGPKMSTPKIIPNKLDE